MLLNYNISSSSNCKYPKMTLSSIELLLTVVETWLQIFCPVKLRKLVLVTFIMIIFSSTNLFVRKLSSKYFQEYDSEGFVLYSWKLSWIILLFMVNKSFPPSKVILEMRTKPFSCLEKVLFIIFTSLKHKKLRKFWIQT